MTGYTARSKAAHPAPLGQRLPICLGVLPCPCQKPWLIHPAVQRHMQVQRPSSAWPWHSINSHQLVWRPVEVQAKRSGLTAVWYFAHIIDIRATSAVKRALPACKALGVFRLKRRVVAVYTSSYLAFVDAMILQALAVSRDDSWGGACKAVQRRSFQKPLNFSQAQIYGFILLSATSQKPAHQNYHLSAWSCITGCGGTQHGTKAPATSVSTILLVRANVLLRVLQRR